MARFAARRSPALACVLLAAGGSRRLGQPKQLLRRQGRPLLLHALAAARAAAPGAPLVVVLGARRMRLRLALRRSAPEALIATNPRWEEGLASSLRAGLDRVPAGTRAILVLLVDQPRVGEAALRRLLAAWQRHPAVPAAARYDNRAGVPAVLPRGSWRAVRALHGDSGARALLREAPSLTLVDMPEAAVDLDTPEDVSAWRS
ncbi:MAG TPA: nucleotidyltransferase family protein [Gammaproteobacteria bacterium]|jgi:CTP:molybdopterin cytidylyltransferase MocA|nr:nucleotidyltransferase family protein [Gammaproteobacteria bacterium]